METTLKLGQIWRSDKETWFTVTKVEESKATLTWGNKDQVHEVEVVQPDWFSIYWKLDEVEQVNQTLNRYEQD